MRGNEDDDSNSLNSQLYNSVFDPALERRNLVSRTNSESRDQLDLLSEIMVFVLDPSLAENEFDPHPRESLEDRLEHL